MNFKKDVHDSEGRKTHIIDVTSNISKEERVIMSREFASNVDFIIDNQRLTMYVNLIEYNRIPIYSFYIDQDASIYIVVLLDSEKDVYTILESSMTECLEIIVGKISLRDGIVKKSHYWRITASDNMSDDICEKLPIDTISEDDLPSVKSYYILGKESERRTLKKARDIVKKYIQERESKK